MLLFAPHMVPPAAWRLVALPQRLPRSRLQTESSQL